ncbi:triphosphoribosyl-dephospho-CoA synthase [uncultured Methanospirillum sp.]|uniref:triphosphoribosyl-dephospho-CoA synthase n=1 Tax=uncultured Methanospirillum sp. TaxID=262503 RepID=UPI0029C7300B|nr:triphosphoribosyl-dephospho-CoA synthase [uncultured Methanospirillum sp.]
MAIPPLTLTEHAQMAMMLEVCAMTKPGNVDRGHDYPDTWLEHFLASSLFCRPAFEKAEQEVGTIGELIREATLLTGRHRGGNTHFGAFILLVPLIMGKGIEGACRCIRETTVEDAILFFDAFAHTAVRVRDSDELDINDPAVADKLRARGMTLFDVMAHSAPQDMVAREWTNNFPLTRKTADLLKEDGRGREAVSSVFLWLLAEEPDTFIAKKFGTDRACRVRDQAIQVLAGQISHNEFDEYCIRESINPGSLADIMIAGLFVALTEGWEWDL